MDGWTDRLYWSQPSFILIKSDLLLILVPSYITKGTVLLLTEDFALSPASQSVGWAPLVENWDMTGVVWWMGGHFQSWSGDGTTALLFFIYFGVSSIYLLGWRGGPGESSTTALSTDGSRPHPVWYQPGLHPVCISSLLQAWNADSNQNSWWKSSSTQDLAQEVRGLLFVADSTDVCLIGDSSRHLLRLLYAEV